jgi:hypothetical protein
LAKSTNYEAPRYAAFSIIIVMVIIIMKADYEHAQLLNGMVSVK